MATITAGEFRNGVTFEMDGKVMQVIEFQHVKPGKGAAFVRTKMKDVLGGGVTETSLTPPLSLKAPTLSVRTLSTATTTATFTISWIKRVMKWFPCPRVICLMDLPLSRRTRFVS